MLKSKLKLLFTAAVAAFSTAPMVYAETSFNVCSGGEGGSYAHLGAEIISRYKIATGENVLDLGGSMNNFEASIDGDCAVVIAQPDAFSVLRHTDKGEASKFIRLGQAHKEFVHLICSKDSGVEDITDIEGDKDANLDLIDEGSGGAVTFANLIIEDDGYKETSVTYSGDLYTAASNVASGESKCLLFVTGLGSKSVHEIDADFESLSIVGVTDKDANDAVDGKGKALYVFEKIKQTYKQNLQNYGYFSSDYKTISMRAGVYLNKSYLPKGSAGKKHRKDITKAIVRASKAVSSTYK